MAKKGKRIIRKGRRQPGVPYGQGRAVQLVQRAGTVVAPPIQTVNTPVSRVRMPTITQVTKRKRRK